MWFVKGAVIGVIITLVPVLTQGQHLVVRAVALFGTIIVMGYVVDRIERRIMR
jgi:hypothetical protein